MQNVQVNQNVNMANFLLVSNKTGNPISAREETEGSLSFANVLQNTSNQKTDDNIVSFANSKNDNLVSSKEDLSESDTSVSGEKMINNEKKDDSETVDESSGSNDLEDGKTVAEEKTEVSESVDSESTETLETVEVVQGGEGLEDISEEDMAIILETIGNLIAGVMQQFDISLEELAVKLEEFGMEPADLMTQQGLKEFFLQMNNAEVSDLIVDENLNQELQAFLSEMSDEVMALETLIPDVESFVANEEIAQMLSDITVPQDDVIDMQPRVDVREEIISDDEPEVIIDNNNAKYVNDVNENSDSSNSSDSFDSFDSSETKHQQLSESSQQLTSKESMTTEITTETPTEKQNTFVNPILQAIQDAMNNVEVAGVSEQPVQQMDILRQVVEQVRLNMNQQQTSLELQLYPEHLGRIQINVVAKEGVMTASIVAETEAAKQAIEAGLLNLREAMEQQDLKVEAIEVMVSTMGFENDGEQQSFDEKGSSNQRRKIDLSELGEEVPQEDEAEVEKMKVSGSSVSYRA